MTTDLLQAAGIAFLLIIVVPAAVARWIGPPKGTAWGARHHPTPTNERIPVPDVICEPESGCCRGGGS